MDVEKKLGGPYSKSEREMRQNEVYIMYFEQGYSAVRIAETLQVNRNTINEDIKYLYSNLAKEWKDHNLESWLLKQIHRLESQRNRLREELDNLQDPQVKLNHEKKIFELDNKITQIITKTMGSGNEKEIPIENISEDEINSIIRHLIKIQGEGPINYQENEIMFEIIKYLKCDVIKARRIITKMNNLGLSICNDTIFKDPPISYIDFSKFSKMRGIN